MRSSRFRQWLSFALALMGFLVLANAHGPLQPALSTGPYAELAGRSQGGDPWVIDRGTRVAGSDLENGGFESGDFTAWITGDNGLLTLDRWQVCPSFSCGYFLNNEPRGGQYEALHGFDGEAGYEAFLYQDLQVPTSGGAVSLWYRIQYDGLGLPSTLARVYEVQIRDSNDNVLEVPFRQQISLNGAAYTDLGWRKLVLDISQYADQVIRLYVLLSVPESFTGPAQLELDDLALQQSASLPAIGAITGRVVDAVSGQPLAGDVAPFAVAELFRCEDGGCFEFVNRQPVDGAGQFSFEVDFSGRSLTVGTYQVRAFAENYSVGETALFEVAEGAELDVGNLALPPPPPPIGSVSGRVVDALSGRPLPGDAPPFALADLFRCDEGGCFELVNSQPLDSEGRFLFERDFSDQPLAAGTYQLRALADEYEEAATDPFVAGEGDQIDVGDIALEPPAISFSEIEPCAELLPQGGTCRYSVAINNNTPAPLQGLAWSLVEGFGLGSNLDFTAFEASSTRKPSELFAVRVNVFAEPFTSDVVAFQFTVPSFVPSGASFCTRAFFGLMPAPLVNVAREGSLFCINRGASGFRVTRSAESRNPYRWPRGGSARSAETAARER